MLINNIIKAVFSRYFVCIETDLDTNLMPVFPCEVLTAVLKASLNGLREHWQGVS